MDRSTTTEGISYISCGPLDAKVTLICIHGWACRAIDFSYLFNEFLLDAIPFRAIAIDLPGHGQSSKEHYPTPSLSAFAGAVLKLIDELSLSNVVLLGHSMGMRLALETWQQAQAAGIANIKALCFLDGSHYKLRKSLFAFDPGNSRSKSLSPEQKAEQMCEAFRRMFSIKTPTDFQEKAVAHVKSIDLAYNEEMRKSFIMYDYKYLDEAMTSVGKAGIPALSLQATSVDEQNHRRPLEKGEWSPFMDHIKQHIPQAQQVVVEDSMHFPHVDQPAIVARKLEDFIERLSVVDKGES
jgi:pimeloyl-ACP methyl ester carboxylesterase